MGLLKYPEIAEGVRSPAVGLVEEGRPGVVGCDMLGVSVLPADFRLGIGAAGTTFATGATSAFVDSTTTG
jgi:hypothetical protein